jgi:hypothetical protein
MGILKYDQQDPGRRGHAVDFENNIKRFHGMEIRSYNGAHPS